MSSLYGYAQSLSEGSSFNARVQAHNDLVKEHNAKVMSDYGLALKQQKTDIATDKSKLEEDAAIDGTEDGKGLLMNAYGLYSFGKQISNAGSVGEAFRIASAGRQADIARAFGQITGRGDEAAAAVGKVSEVAGAAKDAVTAVKSAATGAVDAAGQAASAATDIQDAGKVATLAASGNLGSAAAAAKGAAQQAAVQISERASGAAGAVQDATQAAAQAGAKTASAAADAAAGGKALAAGGQAAEGFESSGIGSAIIKGTLGKLGAGKVLGEAGLSAVSEIGGKAVGDFAGGLDLVEGISNLASGKSFFGNDDTAEKVGDTFTMIGAGLDVVGTAFPPLELLGGLTGLVGGVINTVDGITKDEDKKQSDAAPITDPSKDPDKAGIQKLQVSPAFQSLGLVASAPVSAKMSIAGSGGSF